MNQPFYEFTILDEAYRFEFMSRGKEDILKVISISKTDLSHIFMLTLADVRTDGSLDTKTVSNNGDMEKIIATVFQCVDTFLNRHPHAAVAFTGSEPLRMRLYQIVLNRELTSLVHRFNVYGINDFGIVPFISNHSYEGFIVSSKSVIIA